MPLRVLAVLPYPVGRVPGQRFRIEQWAPKLEDLGISVSFSPFLSEGTMDVLYRPGGNLAKVAGTIAGYLRRLRDLPRLRGYDLAFVYREATLLGPPLFETLLRRRVPFVFDFDDAIYLPATSAANWWVRRLKDPAKTDKLCRLARHVTVGNEVLAEYSRPLARAVTVIPTTIDTDAYQALPRSPNPTPIVGWSGSTTTLPYLLALGDTLRALQEKVRFKLLVVGGQVSLPGLDVECLPWHADTEAQDLRPMDVGLMPLPDDAWSRGKCGAKALQYMALGIPAVVSPVGVNATIVQDGSNGFHASDSSTWVDRLHRLLVDSDLRARLGAAARRTVEARYSSHTHARRLALLLEETAASGGRTASHRPLSAGS